MRPVQDEEATAPSAGPASPTLARQLPKLPPLTSAKAPGVSLAERVTRLTTPPVAKGPYRAEALPRSTSARSRMESGTRLKSVMSLTPFKRDAVQEDEHPGAGRAAQGDAFALPEATGAVHQRPRHLGEEGARGQHFAASAGEVDDGRLPRRVAHRGRLRSRRRGRERHRHRSKHLRRRGRLSPGQGGHSKRRAQAAPGPPPERHATPSSLSDEERRPHGATPLESSHTSGRSPGFRNPDAGAPQRCVCARRLEASHLPTLLLSEAQWRLPEALCGPCSSGPSGHSGGTAPDSHRLPSSPQHGHPKAGRGLARPAAGRKPGSRADGCVQPP